MDAQHGHAMKHGDIVASELAGLATAHAVIGQQAYDPTEVLTLMRSVRQKLRCTCSGVKP